jgi:hypothetical protein
MPRANRASQSQAEAASQQLDEETRYLRGKIPSSIFAALGSHRPSEQMARSARQLEKFLQHPELTSFLAVLRQHNRERVKERKASFLLAPHLYQVVSSVGMREEAHRKMPALDQPAAEIREYLKDASAKSKALADLVRNGLQPHFVLAARSDVWDALTFFLGQPIIQSPIERESPRPLSWLLDSAAASFDSMARPISRAKQHRRPAMTASAAKQEALRSRAARFLVGVFRRALNHPYHRHVATIATLLSGVETDGDYVKKVEKRTRAAP